MPDASFFNKRRAEKARRTLPRNKIDGHKLEPEFSGLCVKPG
jgi:hypothetical protein